MNGIIEKMFVICNLLRESLSMFIIYLTKHKDVLVDDFIRFKSSRFSNEYCSLQLVFSFAQQFKVNGSKLWCTDKLKVIDYKYFLCNFIGLC